MKTLISLTLLVVMAASTVNAACPYPKAPGMIPDGNTAKIEEMITAQRAVKAFDAEISAYQTCLEYEFTTTMTAEINLTPEQRAERRKIVDQKMNAAVDDSQAAADRLNAQIRVYKEKNKKT
ncbi:MAG: hypothetical protein EXR88_04670 [Gammaproteobacteria bacterium]|nr:hypothetical protein [Gammaproteobacteria bacterium]